MPTFGYQARTFDGKAVQGSIEANNEAEARVKIRAKKLIPIKVGTGAESSGRGGGSFSFQFRLPQKKVRSKDLQVFTRQLSVLIQSGVPLVQSLEVLSQSSRGPALDQALSKIVADISEGKRLGDSFQAHPQVFSRFYINMLIAGEEGGVLDQVLERLAMYIEKSVKLQSKIKGAMSYPLIVLAISFMVVFGLLVFVIPKFASIFKSSGMKLPFLTQLCMDMSDFIIDRWYVIVFVFGAIIMGVRAYLNTPVGRARFEEQLIRLPVFGSFVIKSGMAKFSRTLSTLLTAGVPIIEALQISANTVGNSLIEKSLLRSRASVEKGKLLSVPLSEDPHIPHMVTQMIAVGEQTGALDEMLNKVADFYEDEVDVSVTNITSIMEPIMIVVLGGIVAFFVIAMYLPIFNMAGGV